MQLLTIIFFIFLIHEERYDSVRINHMKDSIEKELREREKSINYGYGYFPDKKFIKLFDNFNTIYDINKNKYFQWCKQMCLEPYELPDFSPLEQEEYYDEYDEFENSNTCGCRGGCAFCC